MKVYIMTDMEGISLAYYWEQVRGGEPFYPRYQSILTAEVNAAIEGALAAGATTVVVNDGHGAGGREYNLKWEELHPGALIEKPDSASNIVPSLDETFDAFLLVGYHAMAGTPLAVMPHTQSSATWQSFRLNGVETGEIGQMSLIAGEFGVPVAYVSGDRAAVEEARALLGDDLPATIVKWAHPSGRITSLNPKEAVNRIRIDVEQALTRPKRKPYYIPGPYELSVTYKEKRFADEAAVSPKVKRVDDVTVAWTSETAAAMLNV
jgi:D-amino peptidase